MKRLLPLLLLLLVSCEFELNYSVDQRLSPYVEAFYFEAAERGITLRRDNLAVNIIDLDRFGTTIKDRSVFIDSDFLSLYTQYSEEVEVVVFHELGHALLHRGHIVGTSIMQKDVAIKCYVGNAELRKQYLDELFKRPIQ